MSKKETTVDWTKTSRVTGLPYQQLSPNKHSKPKEGWKLICLKHKTAVFAPTRDASWRLSLDPGSWCPHCKAGLKDKSLPVKVEKPKAEKPAKPAKKAAVKKAEKPAPAAKKAAAPVAKKAAAKKPSTPPPAKKGPASKTAKKPDAPTAAKPVGKGASFLPEVMAFVAGDGNAPSLEKLFVTINDKLPKADAKLIPHESGHQLTVDVNKGDGKFHPVWNKRTSDGEAGVLQICEWIVAELGL